MTKASIPRRTPPSPEPSMAAFSDFAFTEDVATIGIIARILYEIYRHEARIQLPAIGDGLRRDISLSILLQLIITMMLTATTAAKSTGIMYLKTFDIRSNSPRTVATTSTAMITPPIMGLMPKS